jgi:hypothetical protein
VRQTVRVAGRITACQRTLFALPTDTYRTVLIFTDESSNFHPYECDGPGNCIHCDRLVSDTHEPATCALCQPEGNES